jgi:hypothetical protein
VPKLCLNCTHDVPNFPLTGIESVRIPDRFSSEKPPSLVTPFAHQRTYDIVKIGSLLALAGRFRPPQTESIPKSAEPTLPNAPRGRRGSSATLQSPSSPEKPRFPSLLLAPFYSALDTSFAFCSKYTLSIKFAAS